MVFNDNSLVSFQSQPTEAKLSTQTVFVAFQRYTVTWST